jgi:hypothetical protein
LAAGDRRQELATDQVAAQDKEKVDADPAEAIEPAGRGESEDRGVIDRDNDDRKGAE